MDNRKENLLTMPDRKILLDSKLSGQAKSNESKSKDEKCEGHVHDHCNHDSSEDSEVADEVVGYPQDFLDNIGQSFRFDPAIPNGLYTFEELREKKIREYNRRFLKD